MAYRAVRVCFDRHNTIHPLYRKTNNMRINRLKNWAEVRCAQIEAINNPGPKGEAALLGALHFQQHSRDAKKFSEARAAESQTWGRRK